MHRVIELSRTGRSNSFWYIIIFTTHHRGMTQRWTFYIIIILLSDLMEVLFVSYIWKSPVHYNIFIKCIMYFEILWYIYLEIPLIAHRISLHIILHNIHWNAIHGRRWFRFNLVSFLPYGQSKMSSFNLTVPICWYGTYLCIWFDLVSFQLVVTN